MLRCFVSRTGLLSVSLRIHRFSTLQKTGTSAAEQFYAHLQTHDSNVERNLVTVRAKLNSSCISEVLQRCSNDRALLGLRFFIWAGTQSSYRHSKYMYKKACEVFEIGRNPRVIMDVIGLYKFEGCSVNVKTVKVVLNLCKEAKLANEAFWLLRKMSDFNLRGDTAAYNVVIGLLCEKGDVDTAKKLMEEMGSIGLFPDMVTFIKMIKGFCNVRKIEDACGLLKAMKEHGCVPNVVVVSTLLHAVCQSGNLERAMELLTKMESVGGDCYPNVVTYTSIIQSFCVRGLTIKALAIFERMVDCGCVPNMVTVSPLVDGLCKEGRIQEAYELLDKIISRGYVSSGKCFSSLVISLIRLKRLEDAEKLFRHMLASEMKPDSLACSLIIRELCFKGRFLDGFHLYDEVEKMGHAISIDSDIYSILLVGLCQLHHKKEAVTIARVMLGKGIRLRAPHDDNILGHLRNCGESELFNKLSRIGR